MDDSSSSDDCAALEHLAYRAMHPHRTMEPLPDDSEPVERPAKRIRGSCARTPAKLHTYRAFLDLCQDLQLSVLQSNSKNVPAMLIVIDQGLRASCLKGLDGESAAIKFERALVLTRMGKCTSSSPSSTALIHDTKDGQITDSITLSHQLGQPRCPRQVLDYMNEMSRLLRRYGNERTSAPGSTDHKAFSNTVSKDLTALLAGQDSALLTVTAEPLLPLPEAPLEPGPALQTIPLDTTSATSSATSGAGLEMLADTASGAGGPAAAEEHTPPSLPSPFAGACWPSSPLSLPTPHLTRPPSLTQPPPCSRTPACSLLAPLGACQERDPQA